MGDDIVRLLHDKNQMSSRFWRKKAVNCFSCQFAFWTQSAFCTQSVVCILYWPGEKFTVLQSTLVASWRKYLKWKPECISHPSFNFCHIQATTTVSAPPDEVHEVDTQEEENRALTAELCACQQVCEKTWVPLPVGRGGGFHLLVFNNLFFSVCLPSWKGSRPWEWGWCLVPRRLIDWTS